MTKRRVARKCQKQNRRCAIAAAFVLLLGTPTCACAQRVFFGAGVGAASLPRSLAPLCGSARRLTGPSLSAQAGIYEKRLRVTAGLDYTARGYHDAAECIPKFGISVDSIFAPASTSAVAAAADVSFPATSQLNLSVGAGWVLDHQSWFVSGGVGSQYRKIRAELSARWHRTSFAEITREFTPQGVTEISRSSHTENSWGGLIRLLVVTR